ncbi:MAG: hypothetical protein Alpg2KO_06560 [Alphaproteobacteria bacterium]
MSLDRQPIFRPKALHDRRRRLALWLALAAAVLVIWGPRLSAPQPGVYTGQYDPLVITALSLPERVRPGGQRLILRARDGSKLTFRPEGPGDSMVLDDPALAARLTTGQSLTLHPLPGRAHALTRGGEVIGLIGQDLPELLHRSAYAETQAEAPSP